MNKPEAINYCYNHKDEFIRDFDSLDEGIRQFDCLIEIVSSETIRPDEISDYGMDY